MARYPFAMINKYIYRCQYRKFPCYVPSSAFHDTITWIDINRLIELLIASSVRLLELGILKFLCALSTLCCQNNCKIVVGGKFGDYESSLCFGGRTKMYSWRAKRSLVVFFLSRSSFAFSSFFFLRSLFTSALNFCASGDRANCIAMHIRNFSTAFSRGTLTSQPFLSLIKNGPFGDVLSILKIDRNSPAFPRLISGISLLKHISSAGRAKSVKLQLFFPPFRFFFFSFFFSSFLR